MKPAKLADHFKESLYMRTQFVGFTIKFEIDAKRLGRPGASTFVEGVLEHVEEITGVVTIHDLKADFVFQNNQLLEAVSANHQHKISIDQVRGIWLLNITE